jgi:hypothetical protein
MQEKIHPCGTGRFSAEYKACEQIAQRIFYYHGIEVRIFFFFFFWSLMSTWPSTKTQPATSLFQFGARQHGV